MTRESIEAIEAGSALDALVASEVMRWATCEKFLCLPEDNCGCPIHGQHVEWPRRSTTWSPSTSIADAWQVVEKMREGGNDVHIDAWDASRGKVSVMIESSNHSPAYRATAPDAPLAISRCALLAAALLSTLKGESECSRAITPPL